MYIKQIIIQGFKSYKDQTVIEPFSPKHNVIVGRNGSGKSNFFAAIRFVLSDAYTQLGREERTALLHEGAGSAVMSAYVEVTFDNSDERFPTGTPEVVLRRTVGQKKDEYSLNRKNTTKQEVMNLLENAGFSKSNPYYIVPQGRVTMLTNMKDAERLNMLKEVAGTQVYETRRSESMRIMEDSRNKRSKIDELLEVITERINDLEGEKAELREYQELDREKRCLEYTIHHKDQEAYEEALGDLDERRQGGLEQTDENREELEHRQAELEQIDKQIAELQQQIKLLSNERTQLEEERREAAKVKAKVELELNSMVEGRNAAQEAQTRHDNDLQQVQQQIQQSEQELQGLLPGYNAAREQEKQITQQHQDAEAARQRLYAKQGRQARFKTKKERDTELKNQINDSNVALATRKSILMQTKEDIAGLEGQIQELSANIAEMRDTIDNRGDAAQNISAEVQSANEVKENLIDQRKELWREEKKLDSAIATAQLELEKSERFLTQMMDMNTSRGLESVRRIVRRHNISGAYGPLGDLFEIRKPEFKTAVEVTAGTSLFHFVVDTDDTATRILEVLQKEKGGRVTFIPLNRVRSKPVNIPQTNDIRHLLSVLKYNPMYENAMQQVFGKTIVCANLQVAAQYARSHGVTAITPDGDRSDKKGALTGGYHDTRNSRVDGMKRYKVAREEFESHSDRRTELKLQLDKMNQQITNAASEVAKVEQRRLQLERGYGPLREELRRKEHDLQARQDSLEQKKRAIDNVEATVRTLSEQLSAFEAELASDFKKALTAAEEQALDRLNNQVPGLAKQVKDTRHARSELEARKSDLELQLRENLRPRLDQLLSADVEAGASNLGFSDARLKERQRELKKISKSVTDLSSKLDENEAHTETAQQSTLQAEQTRQEKAKEVEDLRRAIKNHRKNVEKAAEKRAALNQRLNDVVTQIRDLGVLPEMAFSDRYKKMSADSATRRLHKVQEQLRKYAHVNKKAYDQYTSFEHQREVLEGRRKELDSSDSSIRDLIDVLDQRKDEAIERTFRQVSREFARVFERLVPAGKGRLIIQRRSDRQARPDDESEDEDGERRDGAGGVENYTGVTISVSFNSKHDEQQRIQQLSGGQKSLCALALVFAIQNSDPAPFYLFDEIDANLDAQYRTAVADLLHESSQNGQFICTTFRPEMLHVADKCYGVSYVGKASGIDVVSKEQALDFVDGQIGGK